MKNNNIFNKFRASIIEHGKNGIERISAVQKKRIFISKKLDQDFNSTVKYGPFSGLVFSKSSWWGLSNRSTMLLGLYEKEVLESIQNIPSKYNTFIDLGAADGYYGVGVLVNNIFEKSYCYELSEAGRKTIKINSMLNNVSDRVIIRGVACNNFYQDIPIDIRNRSVLFIDIEGAEFDLCDQPMFKAFANSIIFIELHEWFFKDGDSKLKTLYKNSSFTHIAQELTMGARDLSIFPELIKFTDDERWLICSEGRGQLMRWIRFDPKPV